MDGWVATAERLPDQSNRRVWIWPQEVTAYFIDHDVPIPGGNTYPAGWYGEHDTIPIHGVTHWMPLPKAPNNDQRGENCCTGHAEQTAEAQRSQ